MAELLRHKRIGRGKPIVILHGLFGSGDNWQRVAKILSENHDVILPDLRNHGSSFHDSLMNYSVMADDLNELMTFLKLETFVLIGHSMGGKVAMEYTEKFPGKVEQLVIVDIGPVDYANNHTEIIDAMLSLDLEQFQKRSEIDIVLSQKIPEIAVRQFILKNLKRNDNGKFSWKLNIIEIKNNYSNLLKAPDITFPNNINSLFIKGGQSSYINDDAELAIHHFYPDVEIVTVSGSGHWVHAEKPQEFLHILSDFLI